MSKNRDYESLIDICNAAREIIVFTEGVDKNELKTDAMRRNAILYSIQIIGEATKRLSLKFREDNSHIPWKNMAGMRDKIVHDYNEIDSDLVWKVAKQNIPQLLKDVEKLTPKTPINQKERDKN